MKDKWPVVTVKIMGEDYQIKGVKKPEYIQELANYLDKKMKEVMANTQLTSTNKISILAALNICDELFKLRKRQKAVDQEIKTRIQNLHRLIEEYE